MYGNEYVQVGNNLIHIRNVRTALHHEPDFANPHHRLILTYIDGMQFQLNLISEDKVKEIVDAIFKEIINN